MIRRKAHAQGDNVDAERDSAYRAATAATPRRHDGAGRGEELRA
jgi:hypothetical protein